MTFSPIMTRRGALRMSGVLAADALLLAGCAQQDEGAAAPASNTQDETDHDLEPFVAHVASLKGPTSIGIVSFMEELANMNSTDFEFTIATSADEIVPAVVKGDIDIALIPANAAAVLYGKTEGGVSVIDINTLGVLNVVTGDSSIQSFADLADKTVYLTGKGATPEFTMNYLLAQAGITDAVTLEFKDEPTEVVALLSADPSAVGVLPQPFATVATTKNEGLSAVLDLTDVWDATVTDGSKLITAVTIVRNEFLEAAPSMVERFLRDHEDAVAATESDPEAVAPLVVKAGIIDNEAIAKAAIPHCHLVCVTGEEMKTALSGYLQTLYDSDPTSVGGALPADDFYYLG